VKPSRLAVQEPLGTPARPPAAASEPAGVLLEDARGVHPTTGARCPDEEAGRWPSAEASPVPSAPDATER